MFHPDIRPFFVMEVLERAQQLQRQGRDVINFSAGEPDFITPPAIVASAIDALEQSMTRYTDSKGIVDLREAIAKRYMLDHNIDVDPASIMVSNGTSPLIWMAAIALLGPGDEVVLTDPYYPAYANMVRALGATPVVLFGWTSGMVLRWTSMRCAKRSHLRQSWLLSTAHPTQPVR